MERGAVYDDDSRVARIVALAAGALILLVVFAGVAFALGSGGDDDDDPAQGGLGGNTPGSSGTGTIIVGGTPTPTMVPPPPHGSAFSECPVSGGQPQCNWPAAVVCPPGENWFVDYGSDFPAEAYGWPSRVATSNSDAINAGSSGCT
jgi:hypothetical protein